MSHTLKNLKSKLFYFLPRLKRVQADIFFKMYLPDEDKTEKSVYFFILVFYGVT